MKMSGICRLCSAHASFLQSHVFPQALAKEGNSVGDDVKIRSFDPRIHDRRGRTGWYGYFLCAACELKSKAFDEVGIEFLRKPRSAGMPHRTGRRTVALEWFGVDPDGLKLFVLWCLWRAANCGHPDFASVQLGSDNSVIGEMLLKNDAGPVNTYPVMLRVFEEFKDPWFPWEYSRSNEGLLAWRCLIHGFEFIVKTDGTARKHKSSRYTIRQGCWPLTPTCNIWQSDFGPRVEAMGHAMRMRDFWTEDRKKSQPRRG